MAAVGNLNKIRIKCLKKYLGNIKEPGARDGKD